MTGIRSSKRTFIRKFCQPGFPDDPGFAHSFTGLPAPAKVAERGGLELPRRAVSIISRGRSK